MKVITGEEAYPFRLVKEEPPPRTYKIPSRINTKLQIYEFVMRTLKLNRLIMHIIHHVADKNINDSYTLEKMCKKAIKIIRSLLPSITFNF